VEIVEKIPSPKQPEQNGLEMWLMQQSVCFLNKVLSSKSIPPKKER
jgi:hypothetical protein